MPTATAQRFSRAFSTQRPSASPPSRSAVPRRSWRWPSSTPRSGYSSAGPSAPFRPSSTSARTCCSTWSRPSPPRTTACGRPPRATTSCRSWPAWPSPTARTRSSTALPRTSRYTAASASPGSIPPTSTSSGPRPRSSCSATPPTTANSSPSG